MRKILLVLISVLACIGLIACNHPKDDNPYRTELKVNNKKFTIISVEGCPYKMQKDKKSAYMIDDNGNVKITITPITEDPSLYLDRDSKAMGLINGNSVELVKRNGLEVLEIYNEKSNSKFLVEPKSPEIKIKDYARSILIGYKA